jgi:hypothetical protein
MIRTLRYAFALAALTLTAAPLTGCVVTNNPDGSTTIENAIRYEGTKASKSVDYAAGNDIKIISHNGTVTVTAGSGSQVGVTFQPFTMDKKGQDQRAASEMTNYLSLQVTATGNTITVEAVVKSGASGLLGADVNVSLPAGFSGAFTATSENGSIDADLHSGTATATDVESKNGEVTVTSAAGPLKISSENGSVTASVLDWGGGSITSGNGDVSVNLPAAANGTIKAQASSGDKVTPPSPLPTGWQEAIASDAAKSYTLGTMPGAELDLSTQLGSVTIAAH